VPVTAAALLAARPLLPEPIAAPLRTEPFGWAPAFSTWSTVARFAVPALLLAAIAAVPALRREQRAHSWAWLLLPVCWFAPLTLVLGLALLVNAAGLATGEGTATLGWTVTEAAIKAGLLAVAAVLALVARDARPAIAVLALTTPELAWPLQGAGLSVAAAAYRLVVALVLALLAWAAVRAYRLQQARL
jgi:hypothetical protein